MIEGGRAINIVPGECKIDCERRIFPGESPQKIAETIGSTLQDLEHIKTECDFNPKVQLPYIVDKNEEAVCLVMDSFHQSLGFRPDLRIELGRTDSVYLYHDGGIKTVIAGPGHMGHAPNEYINTDRLLEFTEVLLAMLAEPKKQIVRNKKRNFMGSEI
jgi:acetylornithine deacetylase